MDKSQEQLFNSLVKEYSERLYWHVRCIVGNHDDADDVMQEVFVKVWRSLPRFRGGSSYYTWLWRIATNESLNFLRRERFRAFALPFAAAAGETSDPYFNGEEAQAALRRAVGSLPPKQRAVFCMRYFEEMPYSGISEITGTSEGSLKASYHIAEEKIKKKLNLL